MNITMILILLAPALCGLVSAKSYQLNRKAGGKQNVANVLVVLSGLLTALAILIPLGAPLLPEKEFGYWAWFLVGALIAATVCVFATIYSMSQLQGVTEFAVKDRLYVSTTTNATWIALGLLALGCITLKVLPRFTDYTTPSAARQARPHYFVAQILPRLGETADSLKANWGHPIFESETKMIYEIEVGRIVFCLDTGKNVQSIRERKEVADDAVTSDCGDH